MKKWILFPVIVMLAFACKKDKDEASVSKEVKFKAVLIGGNEVPSTPSAGTGEANAVFNTETKILTVTITYTGLTASLSSWHIHKAPAGVNGGVIFNFGAPQPSGFVYTSPALTADQENDLNTAGYYVNLHTSNYPGGEIRGQLLK